MENLKIRVNSEAESKEVQELFLELGFRKGNCHNNYPKLVVTDVYDGDKYSSGAHIGTHPQNKEITIQQLRDMVVLKRNDIKDATHTGTIFTDHRGYLTSDGDKYYWNYCLKKWSKSVDVNFFKELKPIEKEMNILDTGRHTMKEFLVKHNDEWALKLMDSDTEENSFRVAVPSGAEKATLINISGNSIYFWKNNGIEFYYENNWVSNKPLDYCVKKFGYKIIWQRTEKEYLNKTTGEYRKTSGVVTGNNWVEIPEGADFLTKSEKGNMHFWSDGGRLWFNNGDWMHIISMQDQLENYNHELLWQRHTQPEELPFIDDAEKPVGRCVIVNERVISDDDIKYSSEIKSNGGSSEYHQRKIPKKMLKRWKKKGVIEVKDVIRLFLNNDFTRGNIFKAHSRISSLENGTGKHGTSKEYDLNKVVYFADDDLRSYNEM